MKPFSLLVKPACADCNLRCTYCFYLDHCAMYPETRRHRMTEEVVDRMIASFMATEQPQYAFGWQGGEPTLMGLDFFRKVTDLQVKYGRGGASVANGLQTNATLIDADFARHLARYHFLLGVSLDGPEDVHNRYRTFADGRGSHEAVLRGIGHLKEHGVEFNILVLVSQANVHRGREVYQYLCDQGFLYHQYIPCVEYDAEGNLLPFSITGEEWGDFLCAIYDAWRPGDTRRVSVRHFDSIVMYLVTGERNVCHMGDNCCQYLVVEHNGDVYPCDFFVEPDLKLGSVMTDSWEDLRRAERYREFGCLKAQWNAACDGCACLEFCRGDCLKHRLPRHNDPRSLSTLCAGWKRFYAHTETGFRELSEEVKEEQRRAQQSEAAQRRVHIPPGAVDRNAPCPCGSGKKFKKCHGRG
jgi:uncharacterized protein